MAEKFEGLTDTQWEWIKQFLPADSTPRRRGMPHVPFRWVLNSLLYILITDCRWCDVPRGDIWASKSSAHRWLKRWQQDGTLEILKNQFLHDARQGNVIELLADAIDGTFSSRGRRRRKNNVRLNGEKGTEP